MCPVNCSIRLVGVLLAWITAISPSGNFTLLGSVTNPIVAEKARAVCGYRLTFLQHLKYSHITTSCTTRGHDYSAVSVVP